MAWLSSNFRCDVSAMLSQAVWQQETAACDTKHELWHRAYRNRYVMKVCLLKLKSSSGKALLFYSWPDCRSLQWQMPIALLLDCPMKTACESGIELQQRTAVQQQLKHSVEASEGLMPSETMDDACSMLLVHLSSTLQLSDLQAMGQMCRAFRYACKTLTRDMWLPAARYAPVTLACQLSASLPVKAIH